MLIEQVQPCRRQVKCADGQQWQGEIGVIWLWNNQKWSNRQAQMTTMKRQQLMTYVYTNISDRRELNIAVPCDLLPFITLLTCSTMRFARDDLRSAWAVFFCRCWRTFSRTVRYSSPNSVMPLQKTFTFTSRAAGAGYPRKSRKRLNLKEC